MNEIHMVLNKMSGITEDNKNYGPLGDLLRDENPEVYNLMMTVISNNPKKYLP
jgi:hypothetical protein